ncbi:MAG TPA: tetratricopeptide repeat protein [Planctomycetota bacterium]|nr:tetratricopeptide repeat protein [Planctomycetota bacterium]
METATTLFVLNLLLAVVLGYIIWRREKLRSMVVFHAASLAVAATLYLTMACVSYASSNPDEYRIGFYLYTAFAGMAYLPFAVFLVVTYLGAAAGLADGALSTTQVKLEDAEQSLRLGHVKRAARVVEDVLEKDPDNMEARTILAQIQLRAGQYDRAVGSFRLAMAGAKDDVEFAQYVFTVAVIMNEHLGQHGEACRELDLIRQRMPNTPQAEKAQRWIVRMMDRAARE